MRRFSAMVIIAGGLVSVMSSSAFAQLTVRTSEQRHAVWSLTSREHAEAHSTYMWKMQASMDTTLLRAHALIQRITERRQTVPAEGPRAAATASRMTQHLIALTEALHALTDELGTLMADQRTVSDRALQTQMEDIQMRLGDMASESVKILKTLEKMAAP